jgi:hypothetical protein
MPANIYRTFILLVVLGPLAVACQQHSAGYDDAWAQCEAEAIEGQETAEPDPDQRATYREQYIRECMTKQGFSE